AAGKARRCGRFARLCNTFSSMPSNHQRVDTPESVVTFHALMRFPLALTTKIAAYIIGQKLRGTKKFATVLQLEPLHTCNLPCTGCGRIREYSTALKDMMSLEDCSGAAEVRKGPKDPNKPTIGPSRWMYWNVHLDGLERIHDLIVEREGGFQRMHSRN